MNDNFPPYRRRSIDWPGAAVAAIAYLVSVSVLLGAVLYTGFALDGHDEMSGRIAACVKQGNPPEQCP